MQDNEPGALNAMLEEQFKERVKALMTDSADLKTLKNNIGEGGLHIIFNEGEVTFARVEFQGDDVTSLIRKIVKDDSGLSWLIRKLESGSITINTDPRQGEEEYKFLRRFKRDKFGYVK